MKMWSMDMPTLFFVMFFVGFSLPQGQALRCYNCYSLKDLNCNDPFHKNTTTIKEFPVGFVCVKLKGDIKNGDGFIVKREGMQESQFDELVNSKTFPEDVQLAKCKFDLCNMGASTMPSVITVVGVIITVFTQQLLL